MNRRHFLTVAAATPILARLPLPEPGFHLMDHQREAIVKTLDWGHSPLIPTLKAALWRDGKLVGTKDLVSDGKGAFHARWPDAKVGDVLTLIGVHCEGPRTITAKITGPKPLGWDMLDTRQEHPS